jgi:hypothetical protein
MSSLDASLVHVVPAAGHSQRRRGPDAYIEQESPEADAKKATPTIVTTSIRTHAASA